MSRFSYCFYRLSPFHFYFRKEEFTAIVVKEMTAENELGDFVVKLIRHASEHWGGERKFYDEKVMAMYRQNMEAIVRKVAEPVYVVGAVVRGLTILSAAHAQEQIDKLVVRVRRRFVHAVKTHVLFKTEADAVKELQKGMPAGTSEEQAADKFFADKAVAAQKKKEKARKAGEEKREEQKLAVAAYERVKAGDFVLKTGNAIALAVAPFEEPDTFNEAPQWTWLFEDVKATIKDIGEVSHLIIEKKDGSLSEVSLGRLVAPLDMLMLKNDYFIMTYENGFDEDEDPPVQLTKLISIKIPAGRAPKDGKVAEIVENDADYLFGTNMLIPINNDLFAMSRLDHTDGMSLLCLYSSTLHELSEVEISGGVVVSLVPYGEGMLVSTLTKGAIKKHLWLYKEEDCYKPVAAAGGAGTA